MIHTLETTPEPILPLRRERLCSRPPPVTRGRFAYVIAAILLIGGAAPLAAQVRSHDELRLATMAPRGSRFLRGYQIWDQQLRERSVGRMSLRVYPGGVAGDDRQVVQKLESGQLDAAVLTATGLGMLVRETAVLRTPSVIRDHEAFERALEEVGADLEQAFVDRGYRMLGWGTAGRTRLFSRRPIRQPGDLQTVRSWVWPDNPIFSAWLDTAQVQGVPASPPEVLPALQTGRIDTAPASPLAAVALR